MLKSAVVAIADIYVPTKFRGLIDPEKVTKLAEDILEHGQQSPIQVRRDNARYVLVTGLHRLEALRALGEAHIEAFIVSARRV